MKKFLGALVLGCALFTAGFGATAAFADKPPSPPGKDPCEHGNSNKPCKPDPQPDHGKDCLPHGKGGKNEDHCAPGTTTTTTTTTVPDDDPPGTTTTTTTSTTTETQPPCPDCAPGTQTNPVPPGDDPSGNGGTTTTPTTTSAQTTTTTTTTVPPPSQGQPTTPPSEPTGTVGERNEANPNTPGPNQPGPGTQRGRTLLALRSRCARRGGRVLAPCAVQGNG